MTKAWDAFHQKFVGAYSWEERRDGLPYMLLDALSAGEKTQAEEILIGKLDGSDDWPIRALAYLKCTRAAPALRRLLDHKTMPIRAIAATAVYDLTGDRTMESVVGAIASDTALLWVDRLDAVICLKHFNTETARDTLKALQSDPNFLISYHSRS
jgi:hypothetical protein